MFLDVAGYVCIGIIQKLATVVSVIEDLSGIKAMMKSKNLIKGRIGVAVFKGLAIGFCDHGVIDYRIDKRFSGSDNGFNWRNGVGIRIGIPCLILLHSMVSLLDFVVDTVIYFSCKSHEVTMRVLTTQSHQINVVECVRSFDEVGYLNFITGNVNVIVRV
ncbi:hypothetical protein Pint_27340 [Pistacia integerrima]|uniref:Uncharacterized protein n=1 Tax=Pistacia integerrima TaxID=434235 RepID=A0ACC0YP67_9ROSI|nr:hypothetical protein Pint_27340 [Pistacia integerrima]